MIAVVAQIDCPEGFGWFGGAPDLYACADGCRVIAEA